MAVLVTNNAAASMPSGITISATTLTVGSGEGALFPATSSSDDHYFYVTLIDSSGNLEIVKCASRSSDNLSIVRAQDNTTARAFANGDAVELRLTAAVMEEIAAGPQVASLDKFRFTATAGQTVFSGGDDDSNTLALDVGGELVTLNGVILEHAADYTVTASTVTLLSGAALSGELNVYAFGMISNVDIVSKTGRYGSAILPSGTTAQRDGSLGASNAGYLRFNTDDVSAEVWDGSAWTAVGGGSTLAFPFYKADASPDDIEVNSGQFPFYKANGFESPIITAIASKQFPFYKTTGTQDNIGVS